MMAPAFHPSDRLARVRLATGESTAGGLREYGSLLARCRLVSHDKMLRVFNDNLDNKDNI
jgi:hypothetical protein